MADRAVDEENAAAGGGGDGPPVDLGEPLPALNKNEEASFLSCELVQGSPYGDADITCLDANESFLAFGCDPPTRRDPGKVVDSMGSATRTRPVQRAADPRDGSADSAPRIRPRRARHPPRPPPRPSPPTAPCAGHPRAPCTFSRAEKWTFAPGTTWSPPCGDTKSPSAVGLCVKCAGVRTARCSASRPRTARSSPSSG